MGVRDKNIEWLRKRLYIPTIAWGGMISKAFNCTSTSQFAAGDIMISAHTGAKDWTEVSSFGYTTFTPTAANDALAGYCRVPFDCDPQYEMGVRVHFASASATATDTLTWAVQLDFKAKETALIEPATVLSTTIAASTVIGTAHAHQWSARGVKTGAFLTRQQVEDGAIMVWEVILSAIHTGHTEALYLLGIEFEYAPFLTKGAGMLVNPPNEA